MDYNLKKKIEDATSNKYEAVIVASKLARKINNKRVAIEQQLGSDEPGPEYKEKVTTEAIIELSEGKVNYVFKDDSHKIEDDIFLE